MRRLNTQDMAHVGGLLAVAKRSALPMAAIGVAGFLGLIAYGPAGGDEVELVLSVQPSSSETVVSKFAVPPDSAREDQVDLASDPFAAEPAQPADTQPALAMATAPTAQAAPDDAPNAPVQDSEPNLEGLSEVPPELIWKRSQENAKKKDRPKVFAAFSQVGEQLPWDEVEPVPFSQLSSDKPAGQAQAPGGSAQHAGAAPQQVQALGSGDVGKWVKSKVTEIQGASRGRPLFHFELWLEPPAEIVQQLVGVNYSFSTPAVRPQSMASSDKTNGFRISAGGLACADEIALTLRFADGQSKTVSVDGCKLNG